MHPSFDCRTCGACCACCWGNNRVRLTSEDRIRLLSKDGYVQGWYMATTNGRCNALEGTVGEQVRCKLYDIRPTNCADYKAGGSHCLDARQEVGIK
jgi:uncharacterized protein